MVLIKLNLRSVWYLLCLFFFVSYTYKAVNSSGVEFKNQESIAPDDEHILDHDGAASVIRSRRAEQFSNLYNYSVHNFSTTTIIPPPFVSSRESYSNTVASLQWIGNPPYQVSRVHLQLDIVL